MRSALAIALVACLFLPWAPTASAAPPNALFLFYERTFDVSQYVNGSTVEAWAALNFSGSPDPPPQVDNVEFRWYAPNGTLAATSTIDPDPTGWSLSTLRVATLGRWAVNATYLGTPPLWDNRTFVVVPESWGGTVVLDRSTMVGGNATLAIAPGTAVRCDPGVYLRVKGTVTATGTAGMPIVLTANATGPSPGAWKGVLFHAEAGNRSTLDQVRVQYPEDGVRAESSSPKLTNVSVADVSGNAFQFRDTNVRVFEAGVVRAQNGFWVEGATLTVENATVRDVSYGIVAFGGSVSVRNTTISNAAQIAVVGTGTSLDLAEVTFDGGGIGISADADVNGERLRFLGLADAVVADGSSARVAIGNTTFGTTALRHFLVTNGARVVVVNSEFPPAGERFSIASGSELSLWNYLVVRVRDHDAADANLSGATVDVYANGVLASSGTTDPNGTVPALLLPYRTYAPGLTETFVRIRVTLIGFAFADNDRNLSLAASTEELFLGSTADLDDDGDPDFSDLDVDGDGLFNTGETALGTDPRNPDTDGDGLPDGWEFDYGQDALSPDEGADPDGDGLSNRQEFENGTDPRTADTDQDRLPDGWEVAHGFNPTNATDAAADADGDGFSNLLEYRGGTDPHDPTSFPQAAISGIVWFLIALVAAVVIIVLSLVLGRRRRGEKAGPPEGDRPEP